MHQRNDNSRFYTGSIEVLWLIKKTDALIVVCSKSLDTKFINCNNSEDISTILKFFLEIVGIVKKNIFHVSKSEKVQEFALKSQK